ncbi:hypothetical protein ACU5AY_17025 [Rhizobium sp. PAMB 3174]
MKQTKLVLAGLAGAGIIALFASQAQSFDGWKHLGMRTGLWQSEDHEGGRHQDGDDDHYAANDCRCQAEEDDDDGVGGCGNPGMPMMQQANPPANGLFTPGSKPQVQIN